MGWRILMSKVPTQLLHKCSPEELEPYLPAEISAEWLKAFVEHWQQEAREELAQEFAGHLEGFAEYILTEFYADRSELAAYLEWYGEVEHHTATKELAALLKKHGVD
jgi:hypothetical protein